MIDGPDDGDRHGVAELGDQRPLAEGLGVRVGVRPAERLGPGLADRHHLLLDPVLAEPLGPLGQQVEAGTAELLAGRLVEPAEPFGSAGLGLGVAALAPGGLDLVAPVDVHGEGVGVEELLFGLALVGAGHVGRRHRDEVHRARCARRPRPGRGRPRWPPATRDGPEQVDLDGGVEGGVEADRGGRVDDDVAAGQGLEAVGVQAQPVGGHVAGHGDAPGRPCPRRTGRPAPRGGGRSSRS